MIENQSNEKKYWKSLEQLQNEEKFNALAEQEFQSSPLREGDAEDGVARREFLKLMGASLALGATACVRRPVQKIVPYANRPEEMVIGVANYYASSISDGLSGHAVLIKTREGRPIKLEPNPDHPFARGLSTIAQAHVVSLYDPDRLKTPKRRIDKGDFHQRVWDEKSWEKIDDELIAILEKESSLLLTDNINSPSKKALIKDFFSAFKGKSLSWNPLISSDFLEAQTASYGKAANPRFRFDKAKYVINFGADYLGTDPNSTLYSSDWAKSRAPGQEMSRHVCFESLLTVTGMNSDDRIRVKASSLSSLAMGLAAWLVNNKKTAFSSNSRVKDVLRSFENAAVDAGVDTALFERIAEDVWQNRGKSLVVGGSISSKNSNSKDLYVAVNFLNSLLENDGVTVDYSRSEFTLPTASESDLGKFLEELKSGKHKLAIIENLNLAYLLPKAAGFEEAVKAFKASGGKLVYWGFYHDETADMADIILPMDHSLEMWSDSELQNAVYTVQQPAIQAIHKSRSLEQSLLNWAYMAERGPARLQSTESVHDYVQNHWKSEILKNSKQGKAFDDFWYSLLKKGVYISSDLRDGNSAARSFRVESLQGIRPKSSKDLELELYVKNGIGDGSYANIAWLQEFPDPVTKVVWDNYLCISKAKAESMSLKDGDLVKMKLGSQSYELPVYVQVGQHDEVIGLAVGYGRSMGGKVCKGVGQNAYKLAAYDNSQIQFSGHKIEIEKTGKHYALANTQGHNSMMGRQIIVEATLADYLKKPSAGIHKHKVFSAWSKHEYKGYKWAMSVDLNSCTGCGSCVIACQAENNVPVVGKKYVLEGREMHWIRIDRYYSGNPDNPDVHFQPMMCQHCDNAPCETVCPVVATTHSEEGLNEMTYNRCVGTRYCSNNCPYKVRRFNWFAYTKGDRAEDTPKEAYNPSVTVRSRGVMEKCTFCVQRIHEAKNTAKDHGVLVKDGDIKTACEQGCPTKAIQFGNMNDPESRVSKAFASERTYSVLEEYNAVPSVRYQSRIRNAVREKSNHHGEGHH